MRRAVPFPIGSYSQSRRQRSRRDDRRTCQQHFLRNSWVVLVLIATNASGITIEFDYSLDQPFSFFDTQEKRDVLESAAQVYEQLLTDKLAAIEPSGDNWWQVSMPHPNTGGFSLQRNMTIPEDTIRIFVGGRDLPGDDIGAVDIGIVGGNGSNEWGRTVQERGQANAIGVGATDFGHWGGTLAFDTMTPFSGRREWHFDVDLLPDANQHDFYTAALHEIPKILGIGTADSWDTWTDLDKFEFHGPATLELFNGPAPLDESMPENVTHFAVGTSSTVFAVGEPQEALNTRVLPPGLRKQLTELDVAALRDIGWQIAQAPPLRAGDADQDGDFDQLDLVQVQIAAKYLSGDVATWGEGDWDGAPGGSHGMPPVGDGIFNQLDIVAAQQEGIYLTGPYTSILPSGESAYVQTSIVYDRSTGELALDAPAPLELTSININSAGGIFTSDAALNLGGSFDHDADDNVFKATFGTSFGSLSFGNVARVGLPEEFVLSDLTVVGSLRGGGGLGQVDLIYVPEPSSVVLIVVGLVLAGCLSRISGLTEPGYSFVHAVGELYPGSVSPESAGEPGNPRHAAGSQPPYLAAASPLR